MPDIPQRLDEIRKRWNGELPHEPLASVYVNDVGELLALVERLMEFVPVPDVSDGPTGEADMSCEMIGVFTWSGDTESTPDDDRRLLTACEVHGIESPDWLRQRASGAG